MLLLENGYQVPKQGGRKAYLLDKKMPREGILKVLALAKADREAGPLTNVGSKQILNSQSFASSTLEMIISMPSAVSACRQSPSFSFR